MAAHLSCGDPSSRYCVAGDAEQGRQIRSAHRCDCLGEQWDEPIAGADGAESVGGYPSAWADFFREEIDKDERPDRPPVTFCPYRTLRDPFTNEVAEGWRWWSKGQLETFRPSPAKVLVDAITLYDSELSASEAYESEQLAEEAKAKAKREADGGRD